jgi:Ca2+-binding RTX toxin-like protein
MAVFDFSTNAVVTPASDITFEWTNFNLGSLLRQAVTTHTATDIGWARTNGSLTIKADFLGTGFAPVLTGTKLVDVKAGIVTGIHVKQTDTSVTSTEVYDGTISNLNLKAAHLFDLAFAGKWAALNAYIMRGNDKISGSAVSDIINAGAGSDTVTGGLGNDTLNGGAGSDKLMGGGGRDELSGGSGFDMLTGGTGADQFDFKVGIGPSTYTEITDFQHGIDHIALSHTAFAHLGAVGPLLATQFNAGGAVTADQVILYDKATGDLSYVVQFDAGTATSWTFAHLAPGTTLNYQDLLVI